VNEEHELIPIEQQTLLFYGKPIIVVRLPDGQPGVVVRFFCENMQIDTAAQLQRIRRTEAIAENLVTMQIATEGGTQKMAVLVLHSVPFWLAGIDPKRVREEIRPEVLRYQKEVVDVLYAWASAPKAIAAPAKMVPAEPMQPAPDASALAWAEYHRQMVAFYEWKAATDTRIDLLEGWQGHVETRLEGLEAITDLIPDILERLGPETLTPEHQNLVKYYVSQLSKATNQHPSTIYSSLYTAFSVPRYQDLPESEWDKVEHWFKVQLERKRK